eukprot:331977-Chlamydomonas_euryale.AAC.2
MCGSTLGFTHVAGATPTQLDWLDRLDRRPQPQVLPHIGFHTRGLTNAEQQIPQGGWEGKESGGGKRCVTGRASGKKRV